MMTLHHLWDWYGKGKQERTKTRKCHTAICEPGSNKGTMREPRLRRAGNILTDSSTQSKCHVAKGVEVEHSETWYENGSKVKRQKHVGAQRPLRFLLGVLCLSPFFCPSPLPFGASTVLSLTRGPAGNRTATGSLSAPQE